MYNKIKLYEGVQYDFLYVDNGKVTSNEFSKMGYRNIVPNWHSTQNPIIVANFNGDTKSSRIEGLPSELSKWAIYRQKVGDNKQYLVTSVDKDCLSVLDYMCGSEQEYIYTLVPILKKELGASVSSSRVHIPDWSNYLIIGLDEVAEKNNSYKPNCIWNFRYNLTPDPITHNIDVSTVETFTKYPKIVSGDRSYITTGLSCLIEDIDCITDKNKSTPFELYKKWENFVSQRKPCLFKNDTGIIKFGYIKDNPTFKSDFDYYGNPSTISLSFIETKSIDNITVYDIPNDTSEE